MDESTNVSEKVKGLSMAWKVVIVVLMVGLLLACCSVTSVIARYNSLVASRNSVKTAWSNVQTQLQRREELIPNLVATVQGYAKHESEVFTNIADARSALAGAQASGDLAAADAASSELSSALSRLLVIVENYPELKADKAFVGLQDELAGTENRIAEQRRLYNNVVESYNNAVQQFPGVIFAGIFGFETAMPFEADEAAQTAPTVNFE